MSSTRRVHPLALLNPYQGNWTVKVRVTSKGPLRYYKNARGEGCLFNVELTDEDGTQIQATMFNNGARMFLDVFEMGKVYYISNGSVKLAKKEYKTGPNDYEMTLNEYSKVEEAVGEPTIIPETIFNFVPIDQLQQYAQRKEVIDVIGVVLHVSPTKPVKRKVDNEMVPKRDITITDDTEKSVVVSLWGPLADDVGDKLSAMAAEYPIVEMKSLRVSEFRGVALSTIAKTIIKINSTTTASEKLKSWYASADKVNKIESVGYTSTPPVTNEKHSMYTDRVTVQHITSNPSMGAEKPVYHTTCASMSFVKPSQNIYYRACKTCNRKVVDETGTSYSCQSCKKNPTECELRYILTARFTDATGSAWISVFGEEAEKIIGCSADDLDNMRRQGDGSSYLTQLRKATWTPHVLRLMVAPREYNNEKRQRITAKAVTPVDYAAESKLLINEISKLGS